MKLNEKVAIVTGGASGIGKSTVREMVKEGAKVVIADVNETLGNSLAVELNEENMQVQYFKIDVTSENQVQQLINFTINCFERLDILFNNAGIGSSRMSLDKTAFDDWRKVVAVNLDGVFLVTRHAIKAMKNYGGGSIINNASILGHVGSPNTGAYSATKGAVINLTKTLALDYSKENIRVNTVCPGYIETPLLNRKVDKEYKQHLIKLHPLGRLGKTSEVAKAVVFLASEDSSFITGTSLIVDGGYTAQ